MALTPNGAGGAHISGPGAALVPVATPVQGGGGAGQTAAGTAGAGGTYTPLPNGTCSATDEQRMAWVLAHPSPMGTPAVCQMDWHTSGRLADTCSQALLQQAETSRKAGSCTAAMTDYDNARQASCTAGQLIMMNLKQGDGRTACENKLNPPKPDPDAHYGRAGVMPVGRYTCYSAPAVIANGGAYGLTKVQLGQWGGYIWVFDDHRYAGADIKNTGTYTMQGDTMVAETGPYKRIATKLTYAAHGVYQRPTIFLSYIDDGKVSASMGCTHDGPPAQ
jgi:hypothetical protein